MTEQSKKKCAQMHAHTTSQEEMWFSLICVCNFKDSCSNTIYIGKLRVREM